MRNKSLRRIGLESRIEDLVEDSTVVVADPAAAVPGAEVAPVETVIVVPTSDAELSAVADAQAEAGDTTDAIDELAVVADRLNEVRSNIEATIPNGGLTQGEAVAYQCATNAIVADVGVTDVLPAMENFGASMSRKEATNVSLEALDKVIEKVIARGKELVNDLAAKIMKLVQRIVAYFTSDVVRLQKLKDALKASNASNLDMEVNAAIRPMFKSGHLKTILGALEHCVKAATDGNITNKRVQALGNGNPIPQTSILPDPARKEANGGVEYRWQNGAVALEEFIPGTVADSSDYTATAEWQDEDGMQKGNFAKSEVIGMIDVLLDSAKNSVFKSVQTSKAVNEFVKDAAKAAADSEDENGTDIANGVRALNVGSLAFAAQCLSVYTAIFKGCVSEASKVTDALLAGAKKEVAVK